MIQKKRFDRSKKRAKKTVFSNNLKAILMVSTSQPFLCFDRAGKKMFKIKNQFQAMHSVRSHAGESN